MIVAGKCPPESEELRKAYERGFDKVELYLEKNHLERFERTVENCRESKLDIVSVHTPHVSMEELSYLEQADKLASKLDAFLLIHSGQICLQYIPEIEELELRSTHGYENHSGISVEAIENLVLGRGMKSVLDIAHLYIGESNFQGRFEDLLTRHSENIPLIHFCDSTKQDDGLAFGEGEINLKRTAETIKSSEFDGIIVLEVMPEHQEEALEKWKNSL